MLAPLGEFQNGIREDLRALVQLPPPEIPDGAPEFLSPVSNAS